MGVLITIVFLIMHFAGAGISLKMSFIPLMAEVLYWTGLIYIIYIAVRTRGKMENGEE